MLHSLIYHGSFELNFSHLSRGTVSYVATDGQLRPLEAGPTSVDGLVIGYMERRGKKFSAVRLCFEDEEIVLKNPVALDRLRHMGNRRFSSRPVVLKDEFVSSLMDDILAQNQEQQPELALLLNRVNQVRRGERDTIE